MFLIRKVQKNEKTTKKTHFTIFFEYHIIYIVISVGEVLKCSLFQNFSQKTLIVVIIIYAIIYVT